MSTGKGGECALSCCGTTMICCEFIICTCISLVHPTWIQDAISEGCVRVRPWPWHVWCSRLREHYADTRHDLKFPVCHLYLRRYNGLYVKLEVPFFLSFCLCLFVCLRIPNLITGLSGGEHLTKHIWPKNRVLVLVLVCYATTQLAIYSGNAYKWCKGVLPTHPKGVQAEFGFVHTILRIHWNPVFKAFHRIRFCGNEQIVL